MKQNINKCAWKIISCIKIRSYIDMTFDDISLVFIRIFFSRTSPSIFQDSRNFILRLSWIIRFSSLGRYKIRTTDFKMFLREKCLKIGKFARMMLSWCYVVSSAKWAMDFREVQLRSHFSLLRQCMDWNNSVYNWWIFIDHTQNFGILSVVASDRNICDHNGRPSIPPSPILSTIIFILH